MISDIENVIPILTIIGQFLIVVGLIIFFIEKKEISSIGLFLKKNSFWFAFFFALVAMTASLFYSEIVGFEPCKLCWYQRIFMYPQVLILLLAAIKKDGNIFIYSMSLSIVGALIALDHSILQLTGSSILPCSAIGQSVSCSKVYVLEYGYITIPMMALTSFLLIIVSLLFGKLGSE